MLGCAGGAPARLSSVTSDRATVNRLAVETPWPRETVELEMRDLQLLGLSVEQSADVIERACDAGLGPMAGVIQAALAPR